MMQNGKSNGQNSKTRSLLMFLPILSPFRLTKPAEWHTKRLYLKSNLSMMQNGKSNGQNSKTRSLLMFLPILSPFRLTKPAEWHTKRRIQCTKQQNHITFAVFTDIFDVLTVRTG